MEQKEAELSEINRSNYKGDLQHYCQKQDLMIPTYDAVQKGVPNAPTWIVTVKWGDSEYTTPEPIQDSKKFAEQIAAKQVLELLKAEAVQIEQSEAPDSEGIDANSVSEESEVTLIEDSQSPTIDAPNSEKHVVSVELVTTALRIANDRLSGLKRERRYAGAAGNATNFPDQLAKLTMEIVKAVQNAAEAGRIEIRGIERVDE